MLFFVGSVHQLEVAKGGDVDAESEIHFALSGIAPPGSADHAVAPSEHGPSVAVAQVREDRGMEHHLPMRVQGVLACVFALCIAKLDEIHVKFVRNSYEIRTNFVRISRE